MATLTPIGGGTSAPSKKQFTESAGRPKALQAPRKDRVRVGSDPTGHAIKILIFGAWGTGKTLSIAGLLKHGLKVCNITTDVGGDGTLSVKLALRQEGLEHLLDNLYNIVLTGHDEVQAFLTEPAAFFPDIYKVGIDVLFWDGFSGWQQVDLSEYIGDMTPQKSSSNSKEVSDARSSGLQFEIQDWGMVRNATVRTLDKFCSLHNKETGQIWHKIITAQEGFKSKGAQAGGGFAETKMPLLQGAGGLLSGGAFDLIIRTSARTEKGDEDDDARRVYTYVIEGNQNLMAKNRGFKLKPVEPGDMYALWATISEQLGLKRGAIDPSKRSEVLLAT